jgi:hypothetical protein
VVELLPLVPPGVEAEPLALPLTELPEGDVLVAVESGVVELLEALLDAGGVAGVAVDEEVDGEVVPVVLVDVEAGRSQPVAKAAARARAAVRETSFMWTPWMVV